MPKEYLNRFANVLSLIFMTISTLFLIFILVLCYPIIQQSYTLNGEKLVHVQTDRVSNYIPQDMFIVYTSNVEDAEVGDLILFENYKVTYIQVVESYTIDENGKKVFKTRDSRTNQIVDQDDAFGLYNRSLPVFTAIISFAGSLHPEIIYFGIPAMLILGLAVFITEKSRAKREQVGYASTEVLIEGTIESVITVTYVAKKPFREPEIKIDEQEDDTTKENKNQDQEKAQKETTKDSAEVRKKQSTSIPEVLNKIVAPKFNEGIGEMENLHTEDKENTSVQKPVAPKRPVGFEVRQSKEPVAPKRPVGFEVRQPKEP